jgi:hypothetical protein
MEADDPLDVPLSDYELGFQARLLQDPYDSRQTADWQRGWNAAELAIEMKPNYLKRTE